MAGDLHQDTERLLAMQSAVDGCRAQGSLHARDPSDDSAQATRRAWADQPRVSGQAGPAPWGSAWSLGIVSDNHRDMTYQ